MPTTSPIANLPRPELGDTPNAPGAFVNLTNALDFITIPRFPSASARNAAVPNPSDGQHAWLTNTSSLTVYDGSIGDWVSYNRAISSTSGVNWNSSNFNSGAFNGKILNGVCSVSLIATITTEVTVSSVSGNVSPDLRMATLPAAFRPPVAQSVTFDDSVSMGSGVIQVDGQVLIRHYHSDMIVGRNVRVSATYLL